MGCTQTDGSKIGESKQMTFHRHILTCGSTVGYIIRDKQACVSNHIEPLSHGPSRSPTQNMLIGHTNHSGIDYISTINNKPCPYIIGYIMYAVQDIRGFVRVVMVHAASIGCHTVSSLGKSMLVVFEPSAYMSLQVSNYYFGWEP